MLADLNSMQTTIQDLKEIVNKNQGVNHEASLLVGQMEQLIADIGQKASKNKKITGDIALAKVHPAPVVG